MFTERDTLSPGCPVCKEVPLRGGSNLLQIHETMSCSPMGAGGTQHCVHSCNSFLPQPVPVEAQGPSEHCGHGCAFPKRQKEEETELSGHVALIA